MVPYSRRDAVKLLAVSSILPLGSGVSVAKSGVETIVDIPGEMVPENLAIDADGVLYFGITAGEVRKLTPDQTQQTGLSLDDAELIATLPGGVIGVEVVPDGTLYVASQAGDDTGVWKVPRDGSDPEPFARISGFPNDVRYDESHERLLVTESFGGVVYEVPLDADDPESAASVWLDDDRLDTESFGANGLTIGTDGDVFVAVTRATSDDGTDVGRLVRVPVESDGSAGDATLYLESEEIFGADGITARGPHIYVAANSRNEVVRVTPSKQVITVATGDDGLVFPSDMLFGTAPRQRGDLFVCNFAIPSPEEAAILRTHP
jgi:sugar lactone lactonase YvrE